MPAKITRGGNAKRTKDLKGKVAGLMQLPVELVFLVFSFLDPWDLLQLARSARFLRLCLMSQGNSRIWVHARANVLNLPPRPEDISEPRYASLLFDTHCDHCGKKNKKAFPIYDLNTRLCRACYKEILIFAWNPNPALPQKIWRGFSDISPMILRHPPTVKRIVQVVQSANGDTERLEAVIEELRAEFRRIRQIGQVWSQWNTALSLQSKRAMRLIRKERMAEIARRVRGLGYGDIIDQGDCTWDQVRGARVSKDLTEQGWEELRPRLVEHLEYIRSRQQWDASLETLGSRSKSIRKAYNDGDWTVPDQKLGGPAISDLLLMAEVQHHLMHQDFIPTEEALVAWMEILSTNWQNRFTQRLAGYFPPVLGVTATNVATCIFAQFACKRCHGYEMTRGEPYSAFDLAGAKMHPCFRKTMTQVIPKATEASDQGDRYRLRKVLTDRSYGLSRVLPTAWAPEPNLMLGSVALRMAALLNAEEGRGPLQYSEEGEPVLDTLYFCRGCSLHLNEVATMTWRGALHHYQCAHAHNSTRVRWHALGSQLDSYARVMRPSRRASWQWKCTHCGLDSPKCYDATGLAIHLREEHGKLEPCTREPDIFTIPLIVRGYI